MSVISLLACMLCSCATRVPDEMVAPPVAVPDSYSISTRYGAGYDRWWEDFGDEALDRIVEKAIQDNLGLQAAWARLDQAMAVAAAAGSALRPQIDLSAGASRSRTLSVTGDGTTDTDLYKVDLSVAYEVDLWGRIRSAEKAEFFNVIASQKLVESTAMVLVAGIAETYFGIVAKKNALDLLKEQLDTNRKYLELTELRFSQGLASSVDVYQQRQLLAATKAEIPLVEAELVVLRNKLAVLMGRAPGRNDVPISSSLPDIPPFPDLGVPADLLLRRPDVQAAGLMVMSADARVAAAVADRLPSLRLGAGFPFQASTVGEVFSEWVWTIAAEAGLTVFDGGRKASAADRARAVLNESLSDYGTSVLTAIEECENAISGEKHAVKYLEEVDDQLTLANDTLREARNRYVNGQGDFLPVLVALRDLQRLEREKVRSRFGWLRHRTALYKALGGTWTEEYVGSE